MDWTEQELSDQTILICVFFFGSLVDQVRTQSVHCTRHVCVPYRGDIYLNERRLHN